MWRRLAAGCGGADTADGTQDGFDGGARAGVAGEGAAQGEPAPGPEPDTSATGSGDVEEVADPIAAGDVDIAGEDSSTHDASSPDLCGPDAAVLWRGELRSAQRLRPRDASRRLLHLRRRLRRGRSLQRNRAVRDGDGHVRAVASARLDGRGLHGVYGLHAQWSAPSALVASPVPP